MGQILLSHVSIGRNFQAIPGKISPGRNSPTESSPIKARGYAIARRVKFTKKVPNSAEFLA